MNCVIFKLVRYLHKVKSH